MLAAASRRRSSAARLLPSLSPIVGLIVPGTKARVVEWAALASDALKKPTGLTSTPAICGVPS